MEQEILYVSTDNLLSDVRMIIDSARTKAYAAVNVAAYGASVIKKLSKELTEEYGKGFEETSLYWFVRFYKGFPEIFDTVCKKSVLRLSWSHFRTLLQVEDSSARTWYMQEAISQTWRLLHRCRILISMSLLRILW